MKNTRIFTLAAFLSLALVTVAMAGMHSVIADQKAPTAFEQSAAVGAKATCPVTGETFTVTAQTQNSKYNGKYYYFCCSGCKPAFDADPAKYSKPND